MSKTSPTKFCHATQIKLYMWSCGQILITLLFLWEKFSWPQVHKSLTWKIIFLSGALNSSLIVWDWYDLVILHKYGRKLETQNKKI